MSKYLLNRLLRSLLSVLAVVALVMILVYSCVDREDIFRADTMYSKKTNNDRVVYQYSSWESYEYLDYVPYADYLLEQQEQGLITEEERLRLVQFGYTAEDDSPEVAEAVRQFTTYYESQGYTVTRLDAMKAGGKLKPGGAQQLFAYKDKPLINRLWKYFSGLISLDSVHYVEEDIADRGITFTLYDPAYNGAFSPAIMGNGTQYKYLLYCDGNFPYVHQNLIHLNLGLSYSVNRGVDVFQTMTQSQGKLVQSTVIWPTGMTEEVADDLHSATYSPNSYSSGSSFYTKRFTDDYTSFTMNKNSYSKLGFSFVIGLISVVIAYVLGVPLGVIMARNKDGWIDKLGTVYVIFIIAVPSLAYIFMFNALGNAMGLPTRFEIDELNTLMFVLPIVSLALPSISSLMKWIRRYMIDQMNSDYVKFARSVGFSEGEIFSKHILKNAIIPIVHGIPGAIFGALSGAIITESVYGVPGAGGMLVRAINQYDNGVIVGLTLFYAVLSVVSLILGDVLMSWVDPRISYTSKAR